MNAPEPTHPLTAPVAPPGPVAFGPFLLDAAQARLLREGEPVALAGRPLQVLALLAARAGQLVDKDAVLDGVWGHRHVTESVLKGAVNTLRMALGDDAKAPRYVETVPRRGYRFIAPLQAPATAAEAAPAASAGNLPPLLPGLVGREAEAAQLGALLQAHRLVTLTGLGGVGKTRLALHVATTAPPPQGVWLVRLDALADAEPLVSTLAQALALGAAAGASPAALARALAPLQLRLVLDNAEHLLEPVAALVAELLAAAPGLRLLVTSQRPLHLAGEQVLQLAPLALPEALGDAAPDPAGYAAARLFCERVRQALPGHEPSAAEHADIAAICRGLDGVPLALELAAARVPLLGVAGVRARLDQRFALLTRGPRDAAARHRTLAAALDWTCGLLGAAELRALRWLALLHGSFGIDAAEALLADSGGGAEPLDLVDALRERSLLVVEPGGALRLFDSVRRHALEGLAASGGEAEARARHLAWMRARFERAEAEEFGTPLLAWLPPLREEVDNLRAALHFGLDGSPPPAVRDDALRLAAASTMFWVRSGLKLEGLRWFTAARALPAAGQTAVLLDHAWGIFVNHAQVGAPADALTALRRARPALQAAGDTRRLYLSLYAERMLLMRVAPQDDAAPLLAAMRDCLQPGWGPLQRRYLDMLDGFALRDRGDFDGYRRTCAEVAQRCRAVGARAEAWPAENAQGQALALQGQLDEACALLARTVSDVHAAGRLREQVPVLAMAASLHLQRGLDDTARALADDAVRLLQAEDMLWWMADALPWAALHGGRAADAARLQGWADALARARGDTRGPVFGGMRRALLERLQALPDAKALLAIVEARPAGLDEAAALALAFAPPAAG